MLDPRAGALRAARALALAVTAVGIAAGAHLLGGGQLPPPLLLAGVVVAAVFAAHAATALRLTRLGALGLLGAAQLALHTTFGLLAPGAAAAPGGSLASAAAHVHGGVRAAAPAAPPELAADLSLRVPAAGAETAWSMVSMASMGPSTGSALDAAPMLVAHVVATALTAVVLASADRSLWLLGAWLAPLVLLLVARVPLVPSRPGAPVPEAPGTAPHQPALSRGLTRRGPPRRLLAPA